MLEDFVNIYFNSPMGNEPPIALFSLLILVLGRLFPIIMLSPFFGGRVLPHPVKVGFGIALFTIIFPHILLQIEEPIRYNTTLIIYLMKEIFMGTFIGFLAGLPFLIVQGTGVYIDHQRGASSLMVSDPSTQNQTSPIGTLYNLILIFIFYTIGGPFMFIEAIATSFEVIPVDRFLSPMLFSDNSAVWELFFNLMQRVVELIVKLCSPTLIAILMTDTYLGIINRLTPQVQITFLGLPLKSLIGIFMVFMAFQLLVKQFSIELLQWLKDINVYLDLMRIWN